MEHNPQQTLEELIHRELSKLPERPAPETLIPRVLAQIQIREHKRWWQRSWPHWPVGCQIASLPFMLASVAGAVAGISLIWNSLLSYSDFGVISDALDSVSAVWDFLGVLGNAVVVVGHAPGQEWLWLALLVPVVMYLACVGLGTLCYRVASCNR